MRHVEGPFARGCYYDVLADALGVKPTAAQVATLRWLAGWDQETVQQIAGMFRQLGGEAPKLPSSCGAKDGGAPCFHPPGHQGHHSNGLRTWAAKGAKP